MTVSTMVGTAKKTMQIRIFLITEDQEINL